MAQGFSGFRSALDLDDAQAVFAEQRRHDVADVRIVVDQQRAGRRGGLGLVGVTQGVEERARGRAQAGEIGCVLEAVGAAVDLDEAVAGRRAADLVGEAAQAVGGLALVATQQLEGLFDHPPLGRETLEVADQQLL